jgi:glycosyltransferase involved in cell wall biosynthesis
LTILFASGTPHLPQVYGGVEINTHELVLELIRKGHDAAVLCKLSPRDAFGLTSTARRLLLRSDIAVDRHLGYRVYRSRVPWQKLGGMPKPRVAIVQNGNMVEIARQFVGLGVPAVAYLHGLEFEEGKRRWEGSLDKLPFVAYIANSNFTAERFRARFGGRCQVIAPVFRPERYRSDAQGRFVTFINPVREKGVDVALAIARLCPEIPFLFVKGWPLTRKQSRELHAALAALPNVTLVARSTDMRQIYAKTRVLLVPSQWQAETWGRVASEAHYSGVPVLASNRGGLPEAVGPGGTIVPYDAPAQVWAAALTSLWSDPDLYAKTSAAARAYSNRPMLDISHQLDELLNAVGMVVA